MENYKRDIIETKDGSHSLYIPEIDETYHSTKGAETESLFIYIQHGLMLLSEETEAIKVLEIGMGTGLNALLSFEFAQQNSQNIDYTTLEPYPIPSEQIDLLNYTEDRSAASQGFFEDFHKVEFGAHHSYAPHFAATKLKQSLQEFEVQPNSFDVVYFDAFAPSKQADIWAIELLQKVFDSMKEGALLTTYCAQGQFKRNLKEIGFRVENPEGPMGKKEMTIAWKPESAVC